MQITIDLKLFVLYSNRTIIIYDLHNIDKIIVTKRFYQHSDCIWGSCAFKNTFSTSDFKYGFATFSTDGSIKIWNSDNLSSSNQAPTLYCTLEVESEDMNKYKYLTSDILLI
jgi:WD40 repeat protein